MTKKKFSLHKKLKKATKDEMKLSFEEQSFSLYPPVIEGEKAFDFNYTVDTSEVRPPKFDKVDFLNRSSEPQVSEDEVCETLHEQSILTQKSEINVLKKLRKKEYNEFAENKVTIKNLNNIHEDISSKLEFENDKNNNFRKSLSKIKVEVSELSKNLDRLKNQKSQLNIENISLEKELLRLEDKRDDSEKTISSVSKENGLLTGRLANYHRDLNEVESIYNANVELINDYKKQIVVNKENINSLISDIEFKNKEVDQKNESIEILKDNIEDSRVLQSKVNADLDQVKVELSRAESSLIHLKEKKAGLLDEINKLETTAKDFGYRKSELYKEHKELESTSFNLSEDVKSLKSDICSKKEIIDSHESKIFQIQKAISEYENQKSDLLDILVKRKQEINKYSKIYELKSSRLDQLESENFNLKRESEGLLSRIEESKIQRETLSRKINQLSLENTKNISLIESSKKELESISHENEVISENIIKASELRTSNLEKISSLRSECEKITKNIEYKQINLGNIQSNVMRQTEQVTSLKIKRDERSEKLQHLSDSFNENKYKIKISLKEKRSLSQNIEELENLISYESEKCQKYQKMINELKTEKLQKVDEKISLEQKINILTTSLQEAESEVYTEKSMISSLQGELDEVTQRSKDLRDRLASTHEHIAELRTQKSELSDFTNNSTITKNKYEEEVLSLERVKGSLESEIIRDKEISSELNSKLLSVESKHKVLTSTISEYKDQRDKLVNQIETREQLISRKTIEAAELSKLSQRLDLELCDLKSEFKKSNSNLIDSNLSIGTMRDGVRKKKEELAAVKVKYKSLSNRNSDLGIDKEQQFVLIDELEKAKSRYINLIENLLSKNVMEESGVDDRNRYIEKLQQDIEAMKNNVYALEDYTKKKAS